MWTKRTFLIPVLVLLLAACQPGYHLANQSYRRIQVDSVAAPADPGMAQLLQPYKQGLDKSMNEVLVRSTGRIEKGKPEGPLNDLLTDVLLKQATQKYGKPIDCSHLNYGGIRNNLPEGNITTSAVFEVMPFDNQTIVLTLKGSTVRQFFEHFVTRGDVLVVGGVRVVMQNGKLQSATFTNGRTLQPDETYTVVMSNYVADGGDDTSFLAGSTLKRENLNYLIRDTFIDYFRQQGRIGQPLTPTTDGRITIQ